MPKKTINNENIENINKKINKNSNKKTNKNSDIKNLVNMNCILNKCIFKKYKLNKDKIEIFLYDNKKNIMNIIKNNNK